MEFEQRITVITVCKRGEPSFSDYATRIEVVNEAAGEFLEISQVKSEGKIAIAPDEWPAMRDAIDQLIGACRDYD